MGYVCTLNLLSQDGPGDMCPATPTPACGKRGPEWGSPHAWLPMPRYIPESRDRALECQPLCLCQTLRPPDLVDISHKPSIVLLTDHLLYRPFRGQIFILSSFESLSSTYQTSVLPLKIIDTHSQSHHSCFSFSSLSLSLQPTPRPCPALSYPSSTEAAWP